jgi:hypothetical protein
MGQPHWVHVLGGDTLAGSSAVPGSGFGGALFNLNGTVSLLNSTLLDNTTSAGSGGTGGGSADGAGVYNLAFGNDIVSGGAVSAVANLVNVNRSGDSGGNDLVNAHPTGAIPGNPSVNNNPGNRAGLTTLTNAAATLITPVSAALSATVNATAGGPGSGAYIADTLIQYGTSSGGYTNTVPSGTFLVAGVDHVIGNGLIGLSSGTTYYYRVEVHIFDNVANTLATIYGNEQSFTTARFTPVFSGLQPTSIVYGSSLTQLRGHLDPGTPGAPTLPAGETVTITLNGGETEPATLDANGNFSAFFLTGQLGVAGPYTVTYSYGGDANFTSASGSSLLTVTPRMLTVTANDATRVYGAANPGFSVSYGGLAVTDTPGVLSGSPSLSCSATPGSPVGPYTITAGTGTLASPNYQFQFVSGTLTVTPAALTVTANSSSKTYGQAVTFAGTEFSTSGLLNGDTVTGVTLTSAGAAAVAGVAGSPYPIVASAAAGSGLGNYAISYVNGTLTVNPAALTITASSASKTYGQTVTFAGTEFSTSGLLNGDTVTGVTLTSAGAAAGAGVAGSPYAIIASAAVGNGLGNYTISYVNGTLTVNKATLTVTANNATRSYGTANPTFTASYSGFVNGDAAAVLSGSPGLSTTATAASAPNTYLITAAAGTLPAANYGFRYVSGTLTVTPAALTASGVSFSATAGAPFSGAVATFTNADLNGTAASYQATIVWGDGGTSPGVISGSGSTLTVSGSHTYAAAGNDTVHVTISHTLGYTATATTTATATVTSLNECVDEDQVADIGFWHNKNGQALIQSFNGVNSTALANWLAATFPNLYGAGAGANNLTGKTNPQVAAFYLTLFNEHGPKVDAEVLATALNVYATTLALGGSAAQCYGFDVSATGLGARSFNVGLAGAAFGVANFTTLNAYQLLQAVNQGAVNGVLYNGNVLLSLEAAVLFDILNSGGGD